MNQAATYTNAAVMALAERYGEVFVFGFGSIRFHWLVGPEALRFVLAERPDVFRLSGAYGFLRPIGGDTALITSDEPEHLKRRKLVQPAFHGKRIQRYLELFEQSSAVFCAGLPKESFNLYPRVQRYMLQMITTQLLGSQTLERYPALLGNIQRMMLFANLPFLAQLFKVPVPLSPWARFVKARTQVDTALRQEIRARRATPRPQDDLLTLLLQARDETGAALSELELRDQAVSLVSAGFDTTSATVIWTLYLLLEHPAYLEALREELAPLSVSQYLKAPLFDGIFKETLRLYPAAPAGLREVAEDVRYKSWTIPKGSLLAYSIYATQRSPQVFDMPLSFKPERWQGSAPDPFGYLPFGYGLRYCIGAQLATSLAKILIGHLVTRYSLEKGWRAPLTETGNTIHPKEGLWLSVRQHR
jgi:cytochrome P450